MSFFVAALPRSRTAWLTHYLSYPLARPLQVVGHDFMGECESVQQFLDAYENGMWGTCETAGATLWRIVRKEMPGCRIVVIRRPLIEVVKSCEKVGLPVNLAGLAEMDAMLDAAEKDPWVASIPYGVLSAPFVGQWLFENLLELEFDFEWWARMIAVNVQVDLKDFMSKVERTTQNVHKLLADIKERTGTVTGLN